MTVRVALIGLGEVGTVFAEELRTTRSAPGTSLSPIRRGQCLGARWLCPSRSRGAAAAEAAPGIGSGTWFLDVNSASPQRKQSAAEVIEGAGGQYVEAAVMSPIEPKRLAAPMLLGGPHAADFVGFAAALGLCGLGPYSEMIGVAAATKLCRSVVIKGVEALLTESMLAARSWGVEDRTLDSLSNLLPGDWHTLAPYLISRSLEHGARRGEEMREAALTVSETGVRPTMSEAVAVRQDWAARHRRAATETELAAMLDAVVKGDHE